jgi:hypothetical protein
MSRKEIVTRNREFMSSGYFCEWMPPFFRALEEGLFSFYQKIKIASGLTKLLEMLLEQLQESLYFSGIDRNRDFNEKS